MVSSVRTAAVAMSWSQLLWETAIKALILICLRNEMTTNPSSSPSRYNPAKWKNDYFSTCWLYMLHWTVFSMYIIHWPLIKVISGQQLPKVNIKEDSIVDPLVRVEIHGVLMDQAKQETTYIENNGIIHWILHRSCSSVLHLLDTIG